MLYTLLAQVTPTPVPVPIDVIDKIDAIYSRSLGTMLTYLTILIAIIGIVIPVAVAVLQRRASKIENDRLDNKFKELERLIGISINKDLVTKFEGFKKEVLESFDAEKKSILESLNLTKGGIFHVQGSSELKNKDFVSAVEDFISASECNLESGTDVNLQRCLSMISERCLPEINKDQIEENTSIFKDLDKLIERLKSANKGGRYTNFISDIELSYSAAKRRAKPMQLAKA